MPKSLILKSQANEVFEAIQREELDPSDFYWEERDSVMTPGLRVSVLVRRPTEYYFIFDFFEDRGHYAVYSPGKGSEIGEQPTLHWDTQRRFFREWLGFLSREIEAPDLWAAISQETKLAEAASSTDTTNTLFTTQEQNYISGCMQEIERYLSSIKDLTVEQTKFVRSRLDYLGDAARRQGRRDWVHTTIGVLFTIIIGVSLAPNEARELFRFVTDALRQLLDGILPLP